MPTFEYNATNSEGVASSGQVEAEDLAGAVVELAGQGLTVQSITLLQPADVEPAASESTGPIDVAVERLIARREEWVDPVAAYARESASRPRRKQLMSIVTSASSDDPKAARSNAAAAPAAWSTLLAAASSDDSGAVFSRFVERELPSATLTRRRQLVNVYPLFIVVLASIVAWPIATEILPMFRGIFESFGLELPWVTRAVLGTGRLIEGGALVVFALLALIAYLISKRYWSWGPKGAVARARLASHTADLLEAGLPVKQAAAAAADQVGVATPWVPAPNDTRSPRGHAQAGWRSFDYAVAVDLPTRSRARLLRDLSACHQERSKSSTAWTEGVSGPLTTIVLGLVVGLTVLALFLPLVQLINGLT